MYVGCVKSASKSPPAHSKLIASPNTNSKFSPSEFLLNSPCMKRKKLKDKNGLNIFQQYTGNKKPLDQKEIKVYPNDTEDNKSYETEVTNSLCPIRRNLAYLKNLESEPVQKLKRDHNENDPIFKLAEGKKFECQPTVLFKTITEPINQDIDESHEVIQYEGYIYKITETSKLKKLWFKLYDMDLFCKF